MVKAKAILLISAQRFGSGDGERKTLLTRQIAFEPLPASVLFGVTDGVQNRVRYIIVVFYHRLTLDSNGTLAQMKW